LTTERTDMLVTLAEFLHKHTELGNRASKYEYSIDFGMAHDGTWYAAPLCNGESLRLPSYLMTFGKEYFGVQGCKTLHDALNMLSEEVGKIEE
jgi:hypothetical protein